MHSLDGEFVLFLKENNIPETAFDIKEISRFIRLNPRSSISVDDLQTQLGVTIEPVKWLPLFYKLARDVPIASTEAYRTGKIYGMDVSSGAVVLALNPQPGDNILDVCCAPGAKLCMIADWMQHRGTLTGVDISLSRLGACKTLLKKYGILNSRLFLGDGCTFSILAPGPKEKEPFALPQLPELPSYPQATTSLKSKGTRKKQKGRSNDLDGLYFCNLFEMRSSSVHLYDKVIVDAECTLDASVRHILKHKKLGWNSFAPKTSAQMGSLQRRLLLNGFRLLRPGGELVYSTCSFCKEQNEEVVQWLLDNEPAAELLPVFSLSKFENMPCAPTASNEGEDAEQIPTTPPWNEGLLKHTVRFYPAFSGTSGMFIAKILKHS